MTNGTVQPVYLGRLGNQLFQYACARKYAQLINAKFESPDWIGNRLFNLADPLPTCSLPVVNDRFFSPTENSLQWGQSNVALSGYFQTQAWVGLLTRAELRTWLKLQVQAPRLPLVAHLRRGDYVGHALYCTVPVASYLAAIDKFSLGANPVWVSDAAPGPVEYDFALLANAEVLLRANSSYSWWAATLSHADVYSPLVEARVGEAHDIAFVQGNHPRFGDTSVIGTPLTDLYLPE